MKPKLIFSRLRAPRPAPRLPSFALLAPEATRAPGCWVRGAEAGPARVPPAEVAAVAAAAGGGALPRIIACSSSSIRSSSSTSGMGSCLSTNAETRFCSRMIDRPIRSFRESRCRADDPRFRFRSAQGFSGAVLSPLPRVGAPATGAGASPALGGAERDGPPAGAEAAPAAAVAGEPPPAPPACAVPGPIPAPLQPCVDRRRGTESDPVLASCYKHASAAVHRTAAWR